MAAHTETHTNHTQTHTHTHTCTDRERERDIERHTERDRRTHTHTHTHTEREHLVDRRVRFAVGWGRSIRSGTPSMGVKGVMATRSTRPFCLRIPVGSGNISRSSTPSMGVAKLWFRFTPRWVVAVGSPGVALREPMKIYVI
jgi:hypothetical protein